MSPEIILAGFPGKGNQTYLGWGTVGLLRLPEGIMLLDAGGAASRPMLIDALKQHGVEMDDITDVFISHMHFDHAADCGMFPNATFHLSKKEWDYANTSNDVLIFEGALPLLRTYKKNFIEEDGQEILPGIKAYMTPGHTPGSASIVGKDDKGIWAFVGDAIKNRAELSTCGAGMTQNSEISKASILKIKNIADRVLPGHDSWLDLSADKKVTPEGGNDVIITFPEGITCNGKGTVVLHLD